MTNVPINQWL
ncbi:hypothetical protein VTO73DRAFT_4758 [Trametes versicolor]